MEKLYYLSNWFWRHRVPLLPRVIMIIIRVLFSSHIPYKTRIGKNIIFGHRLGVVINENTKIGKNVKIRQFVTIGGGPVVIEDGVQIGAGAKLLGNIVVGKKSVIGANAVVVKNVKPYSTVAGVPAKPIGG